MFRAMEAALLQKARQEGSGVLVACCEATRFWGFGGLRVGGLRGSWGS